MWAELGWQLLGLAIGTAIALLIGWAFIWNEDRKRDKEWARLCKEWGIPNNGWRNKRNKK